MIAVPTREVRPQMHIKEHLTGKGWNCRLRIPLAVRKVLGVAPIDGHIDMALLNDAGPEGLAGW
jgi:hypothetical protein